MFHRAKWALGRIVISVSLLLLLFPGETYVSQVSVVPNSLEQLTSVSSVILVAKQVQKRPVQYKNLTLTERVFEVLEVLKGPRELKKGERASIIDEAEYVHADWASKLKGKEAPPAAVLTQTYESSLGPDGLDSKAPIILFVNNSKPADFPLQNCLWLSRAGGYEAYKMKPTILRFIKKQRRR